MPLFNFIPMFEKKVNLCVWKNQYTVSSEWIFRKVSGIPPTKIARHRSNELDGSLFINNPIERYPTCPSYLSCCIEGHLEGHFIFNNFGIQLAFFIYSTYGIGN